VWRRTGHDGALAPEHGRKPISQPLVADVHEVDDATKPGGNDEAGAADAVVPGIADVATAAAMPARPISTRDLIMCASLVGRP
jgi:hypothetical protein